MIDPIFKIMIEIIELNKQAKHLNTHEQLLAKDVLRW